jgi:hypothetical protein
VHIVACSFCAKLLQTQKGAIHGKPKESQNMVLQLGFVAISQAERGCQEQAFLDRQFLTKSAYSSKLVLCQTVADDYGAKNLRSMETGAKHGQVLRLDFSKAS